MTPPSIHKQARQEGYETFYIHPQDKVDSDEILTLQVTWYAIAVTLFLEVVPRQVYLHFLLRFPALYFSRVTRIFQDANLGMGEIKRMALEAVELDKEEGLNRMLLYQGVFPQEWHGGSDGKTSASYMNLRTSWQSFIDSLMREWKTLNIISVLLLSAILTILQIESAAANPLTRFSALLSLVCAFMGLIYGCLYIIRFGTMRKTHKAAEWANESERTSTSIFWNVWVMLAMPAVWLGWSMIFYIICIMSFVWQTGTVGELRESLPTDLDILIPRILISCVLGLGVVYLILVGATFRRYSDPMEQAWQERIRGWLAEKAHAAAGHYYSQGRHDGRNYGDNDQTHYNESVPKPDAFSDNKSLWEKEKTHVPHPPPPLPGRRAIVPLTKSLSPDGGATAKPLGHTHLKTSHPKPGQKNKSLFSAGTFQAKEHKMGIQNNVVPGGRLTNPFVSFMTAPGILDQPLVAIRPVPAGSRSSSPSSRPSRTDNLGRTVLHSGSVSEVAVPSGLRYGTSVGPLTRGDTLNEEHLRIETSTGGIEESTPFSHRVVSVIAVPLQDAPVVDGKTPVLEEMREIFRFESKDAKSAQGTPGGLGQEGIETIEPTDKTATTSTTLDNLPIPRELLEKGLASPTWYDLCGEISTAWAEVRDNKEQGLEEMVETIDAWNGYLDPFNMFLALVQMEDIARQDEQPSSDASRAYSLFLGSKEVTRVGVRAIDKEGNVARVSRLTLRGEGHQTGAHEYDIPDILRIVGQYDGVLRFSDDGHDRDGECLTRDGQTESENSDMVS
ncbi:hypothetical protein FA13DRAFT_1795925 [Coprinellus micaceus]|uniref:Uncharacterized protein n=1 Tax=Coprinellus micaceus TaxID=71717 RepID=A0A4Y7SW37_COPMI|nr:hypothetical protein FA13DRAFT_1795925 [Coprinellus micaceus]